MHREITRLALAKMGERLLPEEAPDRSRESKEWKAVIPKPNPA